MASQMADASLQQVSQDRRLGSTDSIQQGRKADSKFETSMGRDIHSLDIEVHLSCIGYL